MKKRNVKSEKVTSTKPDGFIEKHFLDIISTIIALLALLISVFTYTQGRKEFQGQRSVIWQGTYIEMAGAVRISPIDPDITMQSAYVYFPSEFYEGRVFITANTPKDSIYLESPNCVLADQLKKIYIEGGNYLSVDSADILFPIIIKSTYTTEGELYKDISLYYIQNEFGSMNLSSVCNFESIDFIKLLFAYHLDADTDDKRIRQEIDNEWRRIVEQLEANNCDDRLNSCFEEKNP
jgi:hypothetical protein